MDRIGLGKGLGKGYKNISSQDPIVHSFSAKGISQNIGILPKDYVSTLEFGKIPTSHKKGLIREIARKSKEGVAWAIEYEKKHLPKQRDWVKKEYYSVKNKLNELCDKNKKKDLDDVRDELDTNDDGIQDISVKELEEVNGEIHQNLSNIDIDNDGVPDYQELNPPTVSYSTEIENNKPSALDYIRGTVSSGVTKVKTKYQEHHKKQVETKTELEQLSNKQLEELAIRRRGGFFGKSKYEKELLERIKFKEQLKLKEKEAKTLPKKKKDVSGDSIFSILNPLNTMKVKKK